MRLENNYDQCVENVWALINNLDARDWSLVIEEGIAELEMKGSHD